MDASTVTKPTRRRLSRYGCRNCKLRKLKCDETRPGCTRCHVYGVACNFAYNVGDLQPLRQDQLSHGHLMNMRIGRTKSLSPSAPLNSAIWTSDGVSSYRLASYDRELFARFRAQTINTLGLPDLVPIFNEKMCPEPFTCPALMYSILALVSSHSRYLGGQHDKSDYIREVQYSRRCAVLFRDWLSRPILDKQKDAIWGTAVILSIITFASIKVTSFKQAWPLVSENPDDLQWLRLKASDSALWTIADPTRPESAFRGISKVLPELGQPLPESGSAGVRSRLASICGLCMESTAASNPYFSFVHALSGMMSIPIGSATLGQAYMVIGAITNHQIALLEARDPVALLLLYLWYKRARHTRWCIDLRARYEVPAIRTYLQQFHMENTEIQTYLSVEG